MSVSRCRDSPDTEKRGDVRAAWRDKVTSISMCAGGGRGTGRCTMGHVQIRKGATVGPGRPQLGVKGGQQVGRKRGERKLAGWGSVVGVGRRREGMTGWTA